MPKTDAEVEYRGVVWQFRLAAGAVALAVIGGALFYHLVEKLSWLNSLYFCVITLATVGYGDIVPKTGAEKLFTMSYVLIGVGLLATFANLIVRRAVLHRERRRGKSD